MGLGLTHLFDHGNAIFEHAFRFWIIYKIKLLHPWKNTKQYDDVVHGGKFTGNVNRKLYI